MHTNKHAFSWLLLALPATLALVAVSACREPNSFYCAPGKVCLDPEPCGATLCEAPTPVCKSTEESTCVACLENKQCPAPTSICNPASNMCVQCIASSDCSTDLCLANACVSPDDVAYIAGTTGDDSKTCSKTEPCRTLLRGLATGRKYIKISGTVTDTTAPKASMDVVLVGEPGAQLKRTMNGPVLEIKNTATVTIVDLEIVGGGADGDGLWIHENAQVTASRVKVYNHRKLGVIVDPGSLTMSDSEIYNNTDGGVTVALGGTFALTNSAVYMQPTKVGISSLGTLTIRDSRFSMNGSGAVSVGGGTATIDHSWIYQNTGTAVTAATGSALTMERSVVSLNTGTYSLALDGTYKIKNNIITLNGMSGPAMTAAVLLANSLGTFEFNTVSNNISTTSLGISCTDANTLVKSSIITANLLTAVKCVVQFSLTDMLIATGNNQMGTPRFKSTTDPLALTFFRIDAGSPGINSADPAGAGQPDIDGQKRDATPDMGADELNP